MRSYRSTRFVVVLCAVLLADGAAIAWQWSDDPGAAAEPALSRASRSLSLRLDEVDVSRGGSVALLLTRIASLLLTSLLSIRLLVSTTPSSSS